MALQNENELNMLRINVKRMEQQMTELHDYIVIIQTNRNVDSSALALSDQMQRFRENYASTMASYKKLCELQGVDFSSII